jgi:hypothetical protein
VAYYVGGAVVLVVAVVWQCRAGSAHGSMHARSSGAKSTWRRHEQQHGGDVCILVGAASQQASASLCRPASKQVCAGVASLASKQAAAGRMDR